MFSVLDLSRGFFQQTLIDPKGTTSFSIPGYGQFTYNQSPQGLNSSPAYFQRLLDHILKQIDRCYAYEKENNHKMKPSKCHIGTGVISYLGYEISAGKGIQQGLAKTLTVYNFPEPTSVKEIRAFIGLTSFFCRAIKGNSLLSGPLSKLVRKNSNYSTGKLPIEAKT